MANATAEVPPPQAELSRIGELEPGKSETPLPVDNWHIPLVSGDPSIRPDSNFGRPKNDKYCCAGPFMMSGEYAIGKSLKACSHPRSRRCGAR